MKTTTKMIYPLKKTFFVLLVLGLTVHSFANLYQETQDLIDFGIIVTENEDPQEDIYCTRAAMSVFLSRLYGKEEEAKAFTLPCNFVDITESHWAYGYIAYGDFANWFEEYNSEMTFIPEASMTAQTYNFFILKVLGYDAVLLENANEKAADLGIGVIAVDNNHVLRGEIFKAIRAALDVFVKDTETHLGSSLSLNGYIPPPIITTSTRDSVKTVSQEHTFITDNNPTGTMDTVITTTVVDSLTDSTFHITDTLSDNVVTSSTIDSVTVTKREVLKSQSEHTNTYQPTITTSTRDSVKTVSQEHTFITDNNPTGTMDTVITTTVVDSLTDSTFHITDTLSDNVVTSSTIDSVTVTKREVLKSQSVQTKPYDDPVAIKLIESEQVTNDIIFAPNPVNIADREVFFITPSTIAKSWTVSIYDVTGNQIDRQEFECSRRHIYRWDLRNKEGTLVGPGTYLVVIVIEQNNGSKRTVKKTLGIKQ